MNYYYGVEKGGNVRDDPHGEFLKKNILIVLHTLEETAKQFNKTPNQIRLLFAQAVGFGFYETKPKQIVIAGKPGGEESDDCAKDFCLGLPGWADVLLHNFAHRKGGRTAAND